jgi:hypothetical protein
MSIFAKPKALKSLYAAQEETDPGDVIVHGFPRICLGENK